MSSKPKVAKATKPTQRGSTPDLELPEWREDVKILKGFFKSVLWKYPVHAFIGEIVKGQSSSYALHAAVEMLSYKYQLWESKLY